jgi:hypothetical protein
MHPEVAEVIAERALRNQHVRQTWNSADQRDYNRWSLHDSKPEDHPYPYAICPKCFPEV